MSFLHEFSENTKDILKTIFFAERYSLTDAIPRHFAKELSNIPRLTNVLPYIGWMENEKLFVLDQGGFCKNSQNNLNLGFVVEISPNTGANEEMEKILQALWLQSPTGTGIQISLFACPFIMDILRSQANLLPIDEENLRLQKEEDWSDRRNNNVYRYLARKRIDHYLKGTSKPLFSNQNYLLRDFRCFISITLDKDPYKAIDIDECINIRQSILSTLSSANLPGVLWNPETLLNVVSFFFDPERMLGRESDIKIKYEENETIRSQLSFKNVASCLSDQEIRMLKDGTFKSSVQSFSVRRYPEYFRLSSMGSLIGDYYQFALAIPCPFIITMGSIVLDYEATRTRAHIKAARATQAAASEMAKIQPELASKKKDWDMVLRAFDNGRNIIKMYHQVILVSHQEDASKSAHALNAVWRSRGFELSKDIYLIHQGLTAALPMTLTKTLQNDLDFMGRSYTKTTDNAVMTSPFIAEWKGTPTPIMTLFARRGQIMTFDLFDNIGGNYNFSVSALSGSGKSVFTNELTFRYLGSGAKVWIIDVGRSYRNVCDLLNGEFIEFSDKNTICINPFSMVNDINEDMEILHPLVETMASPKESLDNFGSSSLKSAIMHVWKEKGKQARITDIYNLLKSGVLNKSIDEKDNELVRIATSLEPYTENGVYSKYFEGEANIKFDKQFVVLELEELKSKKDLQAIVLQIMMFRITQEMYLDRSKKKLCIIDEAWDLMGTSSSAQFIETGYRRARKYNGSFGTITQSINDYYKNPATRAALENADWMFLLRQKPESIELLSKENRLPMNEWLKRQLTSVHTEQNKYSEIFVYSPMGSGVGRLILDPFSSLLYSTSANDFEAIKSLMNEGYDITQAVEKRLNLKAQDNQKWG